MKEVEKKKNNIFKYIISILGIILVSFGIFFFVKENRKYNDDAKDKQDIVSLKDDFYESINYINVVEIFQNAQDIVDKNFGELVDEISNDENYNNDNYNIYSEAYLNIEARQANGIKELEPYFDEIDNAKTLDEFSDILVKVNYDLGLNSFLNWEIIRDLYDSSKNVIVIEPMKLEKLSTFLMNESLPSGLEFFTNDDYNTYKTAFEEARVSFFKLYGYDEEKATKLSSDITEFARTIQEKSVSLNELQGNYVNYYKNYSKNELNGIIKNLPIDKLLSKYNLDGYNYFAIIDEGHIKKLDEYYNENNLPLMKEILKLLILEDVASCSDFYYLIVLHTATLKILGLSDILEDDNQRGEYFSNVTNIYLNEKIVKKMLGEYLNIKYDEKYFTEVEKLEIIELINKVKDHYVEVINSSDWLSESTKEEALKKLNNMKVNVGYVQKNNKINDLKLVKEEDGGTFLSNYILINQNEAGHLSQKIKEKYELEVDQLEVNAYYNQLDNSINFPSAFREIYRNITDKYEIYAYVGTIIAHEISHAFDNNGSRYDEFGNLKDWWSEEDKENYDTLTKKISDYYSKYEFMGFKVDGEKTIGENIADLAGVKTIISIMESENAQEEDYKKFFESYAKLWNDLVAKEEAEIKMLSDNHAPSKIRVNAVLSSMDKFYEIYDIKEGDKMYIPKEERVGLW